MATNRTFISNVWNDLKALNIDQWISPKFIFQRAEEIASTFIKEENDSRRIYKLSEGWSEIECMPLIEVPITTCPELNTYICKRLMRTKYKIPQNHSTRYGNLIKHVASVTFGQFYNLVTPKQYRAIMQREFVDPRQKYYFFIGNFIYVPDSFVESVRIEAYFKHPWEVTELNNMNCESCETDECIKSPLDYEFVAPDYLTYKIKAQLLKELASIHEAVKEDASPNLDSNLKTKTQKIPKE